MNTKSRAPIIIGAGPAGLTCAYELGRHGMPSTICESLSVVGGLARTEEFNGYKIDIGGHRFYTKVPLVEELWQDVLGDELLVRRRLSRILFRSKFFRYPIEVGNAMVNLGWVESLRCAMSYLQAQCFPVRPEVTFEDWVSNRFGRRLFEFFFRTYTEKVWGISCTELRADWAAQRIRGLSVTSMLKHAWNHMLNSGAAQKGVRTLTTEFHYPREGAGQMWSLLADRVRGEGGEIRLETAVEKIFWEPGRILGVQAGGEVLRGPHYVSSMPMRDFFERLDPPPAPEVARAAQGLHYRDFIVVALIVRGQDLFPDTWLYVHDAKYRVGRIQNFNNWSPGLVPDAGTTCLGLEYFCFEDDGLWSSSDDDLLAMARAELEGLGLAPASSVMGGKVLRVPKAYPVYDRSYKDALEVLRGFIAGFENLQFIGRNGMHHYNNQDHSMVTGVLAARNILGADYDLWKVNSDPLYLEEGDALLESLSTLESTQPWAPEVPALRRVVTREG